MNNLNSVLLEGNLVRDPESSVSGTGMKITRFTVAINRFSKKNEGGQEADFIRVVCFDKQAELVGRYLAKGSKVGVEGRIQTGSYQDKDGKTVYTTDIIGNRVEFLDRKRDSDSGGFGGGTSGGFGGQFDEPRNPDLKLVPAQDEERGAPPSGFEQLDDDDMPF